MNSKEAFMLFREACDKRTRLLAKYEGLTLSELQKYLSNCEHEINVLSVKNPNKCSEEQRSVLQTKLIEIEDSLEDILIALDEMKNNNIIKMISRQKG